MSIRHDLMYPFGDPLTDTFTDARMTALNNILNLAKERVWIADGRPGGIQYSEFDDMLTQHDIDTSQESIEIVDQLLTHLRGRRNA